jgi:ATP-dependent Lon protease
MAEPLQPRRKRILRFLARRTGDVGVQGRVVCVVHPPGGRGAGGGS